MQYQSYIRLFNYCNIDCDTSDIRKIKKILSAEFSISANGIISIDGFDYSKNDVFQELDRSDASERLAFHKLIWDNPYLTQCLENNTIDLYNVHTWIKLKHNADFVIFISPYFADSFDKIMKQFLNPADFEAATNWLNMLAFINDPEDEHNAMKSTRSYLSEFIRNLKNSNVVTYVEIIPEMGNWIDQPSYQFINNLPDSLDNLKLELTEAMINFTVALQKENKKLCYELSCQMVQLIGINPNLRDTILNNHKILQANAGKSGKSGSGCSGWAIAAILIAAIRLISMFAPSHTDSYSDLYKDSKKEISVSFEYYGMIVEKYKNIDVMNFGTRENEKLPMISNMPYFMIFEQSDTTKNVCIKVINNGDSEVNLFMRDRVGSVFYITIESMDSIEITSNKSVFEFLLSNMGETKMTFAPQPVLISDHLNLLPHTVDLNYRTRETTMNAPTSSKQKKAFIMEVYKDSIKNIPLNFIRFQNAESIY